VSAVNRFCYTKHMTSEDPTHMTSGRVHGPRSARLERWRNALHR